MGGSGKNEIATLVSSQKEPENQESDGLRQGIRLADFIHENKLSYCPEKRNFFWKATEDWTNGVASLTSSCVLPAFSVCNVKVNLVTENGSRPNNNNPILIDIQTPKHHLLSGGPGLVKPDQQGQATVEIRNCGPDYYELDRGQVIGQSFV